jgi:hypothetical protein
MILISHRGNLSGANTITENSPNQIDYVLSLGFDAEVDVWLENNKFYLGHDLPQYQITLDWIKERKSNLWCHCKNMDALNALIKVDSINCFWHETDTVTITTMKNIWAYPGKQPIKNSVAVMPEIFKEDFKECLGICSDYIQKYKDSSL